MDSRRRAWLGVILGAPGTQDAPVAGPPLAAALIPAAPDQRMVLSHPAAPPTPCPGPHVSQPSRTNSTPTPSPLPVTSRIPPSALASSVAGTRAQSDKRPKKRARFDPQIYTRVFVPASDSSLATVSDEDSQHNSPAYDQRASQNYNSIGGPLPVASDSLAGSLPLVASNPSQRGTIAQPSVADPKATSNGNLKPSRLPRLADPRMRPSISRAPSSFDGATPALARAPSGATSQPSVDWRPSVSSPLPCGHFVDLCESVRPEYTASLSALQVRPISRHSPWSPT